MNSDKLNYIIKNKSYGNNNLAHYLHQMFFFEHDATLKSLSNFFK